MSATLETFQYGLITAREFRLFKFVPSASPQYDIAIEVKTVSTKPEERPTYDALSYVCGDTQDKVSILANGAILRIYRSLYGVLRELQEAGVSALLWADAICINQDDLKEKGKQVAMMGLLYSGARLVHVFLGGDFVSSTLTAETVTSLAERFSDPMPPSLITRDYQKARGLPTQQDPVWPDLRELFSRPWFRRLWVMQEAALGQQVVVHWNRSIIHLEVLISLVKGIHRMDMQFLLSLPEESEQTTWTTLLQIDRMRGRETFSSLVKILYVTRMKQCSEPLDRIFAWRWMLPKHVNEQITLRYDVYDKQNYWLSYVELGHIALAEYPNLLTLPMACTHTRISQLPSWCSNLESDFDCSAYARPAFKAGGERTIGAHIASSRHGRQILLRGLKVSEVKDVVLERYKGNTTDMKVNRDNAAMALRYISECFSFRESSAQEGHSLDELLRTLVVDEIYVSEQTKATDAELQQYFQTFFEYLCVCLDSPPGTWLPFDQAQGQKIARMTKEFPYANIGRRVIRTRCGRYGNAHHTVQAGDLICVFEGASAPFVLRRNSHDCVYKFVGDAWVSGLMNGEALELGLMEEEFLIE